MTVLDILFPKRCALCEVDVREIGLCACCESLCHHFSGGFIKHDALFYYELAIRELIIKAKYQRSIVHARVLRQLIDKALNDNMKAISAIAPDAITFVPTHWLKRSWRGLDLSSMFADRLSRRLNVPAITILKRQKLGSAQSSIKSRPERRGKTKGLFEISDYSLPIGRLLLVDDITTTGATFDESEKMLHAICRDVRCLAIAKTP